MLKKIAASGAAILLAGGLTFAAVQSASATAPIKVKSLGVCIKTSSGAWRVMEPKKLHRSQYGKCRAGERKILVPTVDGVPVPVVPSPTPTPTPTPTVTKTG